MAKYHSVTGQRIVNRLNAKLALRLLERQSQKRSRVVIRNVMFNEVTLSDIQFGRDVEFENCTFNYCNFSNIKVGFVEFDRCKMNNCEFDEVQYLGYAIFQKCNLWKPKFQNMVIDFDMRSTHISNTKTSGIRYFALALKEESMMFKTQASGVEGYISLSNSVVNGSNFSSSILNLFAKNRSVFEGCDFTQSNLEGSQLDVTTILGDCTFQEAWLGKSYSEAFSRNGNLSGVKDAFDPSTYLNEHFEWDDEGLIVYKAFNMYYNAPEHWEIEPGAVITEAINPNIYDDCGYGINVATKDWFLGIQSRAHGSIWKCRIPFKKLAGIVVPIRTDGKIRTNYLELIEPV